MLEIIHRAVRIANDYFSPGRDLETAHIQTMDHTRQPSIEDQQYRPAFSFDLMVS